MRFKCFLLVTGLALLLGPTVGMSQFGGQPGGYGGPAGGGGGRGPGGFGGQGMPGGGFGGRGGGFTMDPNERWNQYTGGKAVWKRSEITDPNMVSRFDRIAQMVGSTNGEITKDQYVGMMQGFAQRFTQQGNAPTGGSPTGAPLAPGFSGGQNPWAGYAGGQPGGWNQPGGWGGRPRGGFGSGGGGLNVDAIAAYRFRQLDTNGDGLLNNDELAADETLHSERQKWDTNGDGNIDLNEFTEYIRARVQQFQAGGGSSGWNPLQPPEDDADKKPTVYRAGKLPPNIPPWFRQYDTDGDGQVGLYEWKAQGRAVAEFEAMDVNGDGFLTVEEVMKTVVAKAGDGSSPGAGTGGFAMGPGGFGGRGGFGGGGRNRGMGGFGGGQGMPGGGFGGFGGGGGRNRGMGGFGGFGGGQGMPGADQGGGFGGRNRGFGGPYNNQGMPGGDQGGGRRGRGRGMGGFGGNGDG
jgi:Ca2+-binding EF-hand superfamily protein